MVDFTLRVKLKCQFENTDEVREYFTNHRRLKGYEIGVHTKYADRIENGCGPYKYIQGEDLNLLKADLSDWARVKFNLSKQDAKAMGEHIAERFWEYGMPPHRFFKPTIAWIDQNKQELFNSGYSIGEICHMAENRIIDEIMKQNLLYKGTMLQSVSCRPLDDKELLSKDTRKVSLDDLYKVQASSPKTGNSRK